MLYLMIRQRLQRLQRLQRSQVAARSVEYAAQLPPEPAPPHQWTAVDPTPYAMRTRPDAQNTAQLGGVDRWIAQHQTYPEDTARAAYGTILNGQALVVSDNLFSCQDAHGIFKERTTRVRLTLPAPAPSVLVQARNPVHGHRDLMFSGSVPLKMESDDFNQAYAVFSLDERGAFSVIDGRMMEWLLGHPMLLELCIHNTDVLLVCAPKDKTDYFDPEYVIPFVSGFLSRLFQQAHA
jgi:hypothetical protein